MKKNKVEILESNTNGKGVFALSNIKKGEVVLGRKSIVIPSIIVSILPRYIKERSFPYNNWLHLLPSKPGMSVNHSCDPNCGIANNTDLIAMKDIKKGEEITYDYSMISVDNWNMTCNCNAENCRGVVKDYKFLSKEIKQKYKDFVPEWVKVKYDN